MKRVKIFKSGAVNTVYECELSAYKKNGWTDVEPKLEVETSKLDSTTKFKTGKK